MIEELTVKGFEGYKAARIPFTQGLNLITGRNSTGKTTLLNAILFTLYGEVPGAEKRLIVSRLQGSPRRLQTSIKFRSLDGSLVEVRRWGSLTRSKGKESYRKEGESLIVNGKPVQVSGEEDLRRKVKSLLGLSLKKFLNLAYVRQGELTRILEPRREDMDSILRINLLRELKEQLSQVKRRLERFDGQDAKTLKEFLETVWLPDKKHQLEELKNRVKQLRCEVARLEETLRKVETPEFVYLVDAIEKRDRLREEVKGERQRLKGLLEAVKASTLAELNQNLSMWRQKLEEAEEAVVKAEEELRRVEHEKSKLEGILGKVREEYEVHRRLLEEGVNRCPLCGQTLTPESLREILSRDEKLLREMEKKIGELEEPYERAKEEYERQVENLQKVRGEVDQFEKIKGNVESVGGKLKSLEEELNNSLLEIEGFLSILNLLLNHEDPDLKAKLAQQLPVTKEKLEELRGELEGRRGELEKAESEAGRLEEDIERQKKILEALKVRLEKVRMVEDIIGRLERGIEDIRTVKLRDIEAEALNIYRQLTDQHVYETFRIDPETYRVEVKPENLDSYIPATRVGGGHQTLIALALRIAMLKVLGGGSILILDEPTYGVDAENMPQLLGYIAEATKTIPQVILVTHHSLGEEEASNIIRVEIGPDGASKATPIS